MNITVDTIKEALSHVNDPDLGKDLVSLGMIANIKIDKHKVGFDLVLTTPACPMKQKMKQDCLDAIAKYISKDVEVEVNLTAKVRQSDTKEHESLKNVKNIILVGSGKGGVGKSTVSANLALALAKSGSKVALVDADIYGPSIPLLFNLLNVEPQGVQEGEKTWLKPVEQYGIKIMSIGFFVDPKKALLWRGPMASNALKQMFTDTQWGEIDYMVVDLPPGTGDVQITLSQMIPEATAILVSTPQKMAIADVRRAASMFREVKTPILGVVENMAYFTPVELPNNKYYIFGKGGCEALATECGFPVLAQIPIVESVCEQADKGIPVMVLEGAAGSAAEGVSSGAAEGVSSSVLGGSKVAGSKVAAHEIVKESFERLAGVVACEISKRNS